MTSPRDSHTATLLSNGKVLLAGGIDGISISATAELYDSDTSTFQATGSMNTARAIPHGGYAARTERFSSPAAITAAI